jgi:phage terminase Nu1 subunit (DNA packaging protein)
MSKSGHAQAAQTVDTHVIAQLFNITERRVQQLVKESVLGATTVKGNLRFDFVIATQQYIKHLTELAKNKSGKQAMSELERQKLEAEVKYKDAKAAILELEQKELEGLMHHSDDVEAMITDLIMTVRAMILGMPGRLAVDLAAMSHPAEIQIRIRSEGNSILEALTHYEYDPEVYAQKVRERQGWHDKTGGADEEDFQ